MPKNEKYKITLNDDIKINDADSSLAEFTKRRLPTDQEVEEFDEIISEESKEGEIDQSLNEIYQDDKGNMVDVKKLDIKKRKGLFFRLFQFVFTLALAGGVVYGAYYYLYLKPGSDVTAVDFRFEANNEVLAGEEFSYSIYYKNESNIAIRDARIEVSYPGHFIYVSSQPAPATDKNSVWEIPLIAPKFSGKIVIKGKIIGPKGDSGIIVANLTYKPEGISTEFRKEASYTTVVKDVGVDFDFDHLPSSLVGEANDITLRFSAKEVNYLKNFRLTFEPQENIEFLPENKTDETVGTTSYTIVRPGVWQINDPTIEIVSLPIRFKFTKKSAPSQDVTLYFEELGGADRYYRFYEQKLTYEVMKNDLNLTLILNGSRDNQGIEFGQDLNYSITYANKGDSDMKDVVLMAALSGGLADWQTFTSSPPGKQKGNVITWSKEEIPGLAEIKQGQEGTIDFKVKVVNIDSIEEGKSYEIKSYAQFSVGEIDPAKDPEKEENRSNSIISKINSNINLSEKVRYFSEDNIPVGTGPHPPKIGQTTTYKVYWQLTNSLHELNDVVASVKLPDYVNWDGKETYSVGSLQYDSASREVRWNLGRLPITVMQASAEFSISITPGDQDENKIIVLLPGSNVSATDSETGGVLTKSTKAETTMLEDDEIAGGDGIVQR